MRWTDGADSIFLRFAMLLPERTKTRAGTTPVVKLRLPSQKLVRHAQRSPSNSVAHESCTRDNLYYSYSISTHMFSRMVKSQSL
jgi:hypothetical protein